MWKRHIQERGSFAPKRSRMVFDQMRRAARNLAISSKKSLCELKKKDSRGANSSTGSPASMPYCTYSTPSRSVKASSCRAVEPASRMWYPEIEIVFHFGTCFAQKENWSVIRRIDGRGGKMYSFWAMYSLRMSFWSVPPTFSQDVPCFSATARYIASAIGAVELIVIDVVTLPRSMRSKSTSMSRSESIATPHLPTSPRDM